MYAPRIFMMIRPQFNPAKIAKGIDVRYYIDRYGYACAQERAWMDVVGVMYEELENYLSASGTAEEILKELKHKSRRMKISHLEDGYRMGNLNGGAGAEIFERNESLGVTFFHSAGYIYTNQSWDLSYYGSDNAAAFIAASLRAYRIIGDKFRNSCYAA